MSVCVVGSVRVTAVNGLHLGWIGIAHEFSFFVSSLSHNRGRIITIVRFRDEYNHWFHITWKCWMLSYLVINALTNWSLLILF